MLVTHTVNASGHRRVYLGGKASLECWIEPCADSVAWTFHIESAAGGACLDDAARREWAVHTLLALARELAVAPTDLHTVPFECIAALHASNPTEYRRVPVPRRQALEQGFMATAPNVSRPQGDFTGRDYPFYRNRYR